MKNISPLYKFFLKGGGWDEQRQPKMQPSAEIVRVVCAKCRRECDLESSAEIVRVECAKCRRECDLTRCRATLCGDRACRVREMRAIVRFVRCARNPLRRSCVSCARNAGESAIWPVPAQASAEIVRVECAKCRRECDLSDARAALCGDRACRVRDMQTRVRFIPCPRNPLRRSCVLSARNAGESAIGAVRAQPSAEIVRVACAKCSGFFRWTHRSASHWRTCQQMAPSTPPSWPRWPPPCLRRGQCSCSESLPDAWCHLDVHMVTNCMSHTMNSSSQLLCGRRLRKHNN